MGLVYDLFANTLSISLGDADFLVGAFTGTILACIAFMTVFLGTIYFCIFVNDFLFYIYRKASHQTVEYLPPEARAIRRRHRAGLGVLMIILLVSIGVWGFFLLNTKPTTLHINQRSDAVTITGATASQIRIRSFVVIAGYLTPSELQDVIEGGVIDGGSGSPGELLGGIVYFIPPPFFDFSGYLTYYDFDYQLVVPCGQNIMGFSLAVYIDIGTDEGSFGAYFFPTAGYECGALSKNFAISAVTVVVDGGGQITDFTFEVSLGDQFYWSDLLNFGW
jgi:hypothetical protein